MSAASVNSRLLHLETKLLALQQTDVRYPYDAYEDFSSWYAARSNNPNSILLADTDGAFSEFDAQETAWIWLFQTDGRFNIANTGNKTLWIKIGTNYVFIIPLDKATIIVKGGALRVF
jgi:hypothetical protein